MLRGCLTILVLLLTSGQSWADSSSWSQGAVGFFKAERHARSRNAPMLVYFRTEWCDKCARLDQKFLSDPSLRSLLSLYTRVRINPELGPKEHAIFSDFQSQAVPGLFVFFPSMESTRKRIHPLGKKKDWSLIRFEEEIVSYTAETYRQEGARLMSAKRFRDAAKHYEKSLKFESKSAESYYQLGLCYQSMGGSYTLRAEQYFAKAAQIDDRYRARAIQ